jgi:hypothetical protein
MMPYTGNGFVITDCVDPDAPEIAYATMLGGVFTYSNDVWTCCDRKHDSGEWLYKCNAARALLSFKGLHVSEDGQIKEHPVAYNGRALPNKSAEKQARSTYLPG